MRCRTGSMLIVALVTVFVVTMLSVSLSISLKANIELAGNNSYIRETRRGCANAAMCCFAETLVADTNGYDTLNEPWAAPWERRENGLVMRVSANGWNNSLGKTDGLTDESGKIPLGLDKSEVYEAILRLAANAPSSQTAVIAAQLTMTNFVCIEQLASVTGMTHEVYVSVAPYLTAAPTHKININTAPDVVLRAIFECLGKYDKSAALNLMSRVRALRTAGGCFTSESAALAARTLGGLPANEALLLNVCEEFLTVKSDIFSGIVEATPARVWESGRKSGRASFIWNRKTGRFIRWVED